MDKLDTDASRLYSDLLRVAVNEAVREEIRNLDPSRYDPNGVIADFFVEYGRKQGHTAGCAALLVRQLTLRFGPLPDEVLTHLKKASTDPLDLVGERLLSAPTLQHALGSLVHSDGVGA